MTVLYGDRTAFGAPGVTPRWTRSAKEGVGTAYSASSRVWFTLSHGILNEIYYPRIDRPQIRDMEYLITDGETFFHEEKRHLTSEIEQLNPTALGYRIVNSDPEGRYRIIKEIISDPHLPCVLVHTRVEAAAELRRKLRLFALLAPHLDVGGAHNNGHVAEVAGQDILVAYKENTWLALGADIPFLQRSCGYVGTSDGWTDLASDLKLDWKFDVACDGNIALIGELDVMKTEAFTLGIGFGDGLHAAATALFQSLGVPYEEQRARFIEQWGRSDSHRLPLAPLTGDDGKLFHTSHSLLLAHEDKTFQGALIASLSIPWGEVKGDDELGGYHLVWTRDMVNSAGGLVAAGHVGTAFRALIYLASTQLPDGGFHQNFWLDGSPYWTGVQLDEVSFPILLAWRLHHHGALDGFDPYPMVVRAAGYLIRHGPATPQERWEENSGYSPSTLAAGITALNCAAGFAQMRGDAATARFIQEYADFLEAHIEAWTVTTQGTLVPGIPRHYIRINPVDPSEPHPDE
ncbi:MAG TPA: glycoside hydrolase family 15 protein, partial [Limnochordia bacterium]|nr:glycoside hydrolase family 15 protein [Limnochordia bacterium]